MDCEVLAIGTELLLGQVIDTNSAWIGERLAAAGIPCYQQTKVGDNHTRIVAALHAALERGSDVICCGGLGPTQDDITREAIAEVMGVSLRREPDLVARLNERFAGRGDPRDQLQAGRPPRRRFAHPGFRGHRSGPDLPRRRPRRLCRARRPLRDA